MLACGMESAGVMAELTGPEGGYSRGKGGSMHMFSREKNFYGGTALWARRCRWVPDWPWPEVQGHGRYQCDLFRRRFCQIQGQVYEAFNMAALWKLPVIYVIENNQYAMGTSVARSSAQTEMFKRGDSFGVGRQVDGMDVLTVKAAAEEAVEYVRGGNGPIILEMKTYRYRPFHVGSGQVSQQGRSAEDAG